MIGQYGSSDNGSISCSTVNTSPKCFPIACAIASRATPHNLTRRLSQDFCPNSKFGKRRNTVCISACQKSLAEFAARRRQRDSDHFLSGRVPDRKYNSGCKCAICTPKAYKSCARQTAILLSKRAKPFFDSLEYCMYFSFFKLKKWGKKTTETRSRNCAVLP